MTDRPRWRELTEEQRKYFALGWWLSREGFNFQYGPSAAGAWSALRSRDDTYDPEGNDDD